MRPDLFGRPEPQDIPRSPVETPAEAHRRWLKLRAADAFIGPIQPTPQELAQLEWEMR